MGDCIFCKIIAGQMPANIVYSDEQTFAFLDINPANKGHTLVLPRKHYTTFNDIPEAELQNLFAAVQKISKGMEKGLNADGYNVLNNNKKPAGQLVDHVHIHIIPRFKGDEMAVRLGWSYKKYEEGEAREFADRIKRDLH